MKEHSRRMGKTTKNILRLERKLFSDEDLSMEREMTLETFLTRSKSKASYLASMDISKTSVAARLLLDHSSEMGVEVDLISRLALKDSTLLLVKPLELKSRALILASALGFGNDTRQVLDLAIENPLLLARGSSFLAKNLPNMSALFKSRGLSLAEMSRMQPDLLLQAPGTLRNKMEAIPAALDLPPRMARDLVAICPLLLRRSPNTLHERFKLLQKMFDSVPRNFLSELVLQEPRILCYSSTTMREKFASLLSKYGSFQDDVVDMILVDPKVLLNAQPLKQEQDPRPSTIQAAVKDKVVKQMAVPAPLTGVERLVGLSKELDADLSQVIDLVLQSSPISPASFSSPMTKEAEEFQPGDVSARISSLADSLGVDLNEARTLVKSDPKLIFLPPNILSERALQLSVLSPSLLMSYPKLLGRDSREVRSQVQKIEELLGAGSVQPLLNACPGLLMMENLTERIVNLGTCLGISLILVKELILKEPGLLVVPLEEIEAAFESLAQSFGSFRDDALQIVLADPKSLLAVGADSRRKDEKQFWGQGNVPTAGGSSKKNKKAKKSSQA